MVSMLSFRESGRSITPKFALEEANLERKKEKSNTRKGDWRISVGKLGIVNLDSGFGWENYNPVRLSHESIQPNLREYVQPARGYVIRPVVLLLQTLYNDMQ